MRRTGSGIGVWLALLAAAGVMYAAPAMAGDYCCLCKGKTTGKDLQASDDVSAGLECTLSCKRPTLPRSGKCEAPPATTPAAPAPAASAAPAQAPAGTGTSVLLFASDDCSGDAKKVSASSPNLADQSISGARSFMVESGSPASVWQKPGYSGAQVEPVGAGLCVSPGWEIAGVRVQGQ